MDSYLHSNFSLHDLLENQIPKEIRGLEESSSKLEHVAAYCENEYGRAFDKKNAFEQTKQLTIQSLASVAYQVNQISSALLRSLDLELESVNSKTNEVNNSTHELDIQREKTARQEIGKLTMNKSIRKENKIRYPDRKPMIKRHQFIDLDFSALDHIGHGVFERERNYNTINVNRTNSMLSGSDTVSSHGQPQYDFLLPRGQSTLTRKSIRSDVSTVYRTPQIPNIGSDRGYSSVNRSVLYSDRGSGNYASTLLRTPSNPASQLGSVSQYRLSIESTDGLPAPPNALVNPSDEPLPPPPFEDIYGHTPDVQTPTNSSWVPPVYIEKARALYDYEAEKEDELNLREDCIVYVVAKNDDGWYEGVVDGVTGLFPSNYVQKIS